jgi:hypothetical protein
VIEKSYLHKALCQEAESIIRYKRPETIYLNPEILSKMAGIAEEALSAIDVSSVDPDKLLKLTRGCLSLMDEKGTSALVKEVVIDSFKKLADTGLTPSQY